MKRSGWKFPVVIVSGLLVLVAAFAVLADVDWPL